MTKQETNARRGLRYRSAFLEAITPADIKATVKAMVERAKSGDVPAARLLFDRVIGPDHLREWPTEAGVEADDFLTRISGR